MTNSSFTRGITILAVCILALVAMGSGKKPVERPFKVQGQFTFTIDRIGGTVEIQGFGEATHNGHYTAEALGTYTPWGLVMNGTTTSANGDQVFWVSPGSSWSIEFTGGTGRFEGCSGGYNPSLTLIDGTVNPDGTESLTYTQTGVGIIVY